jgi:hypothetical protein
MRRSGSPSLKSGGFAEVKKRFGFAEVKKRFGFAEKRRHRLKRRLRRSESIGIGSAEADAEAKKQFGKAEKRRSKALVVLHS